MFGRWMTHARFLEIIDRALATGRHAVRDVIEDDEETRDRPRHDADREEGEDGGLLMGSGVRLPRAPTRNAAGAAVALPPVSEQDDDRDACGRLSTSSGRGSAW